MKECRNLDGVYFRIKRDGKWQDICFSDLTDEEMYAILESRSVGWLKRLCVNLAHTLYEMGER